jgi:ABC-type sugar transport system substrate-binding protein
LAVFVVGLGACDKPGDVARRSGREDRRPVAMVGNASDTRWAAVVGGARRYVEGVPITQLHVEDAEEGTPTALSEAVTRAIAAEPFALCLFVPEHGPQQAEALRALCARITPSRVLIITMGAPIEGADVYAHIGPDWTGAADLLGDGAPDIAKPRKSYVLLHADGRSERSTDCYNRFSAAARERHGDNWHLLAERNLIDGAGDDADQIRQLITLFPHVGLVVTLDADVWVTAQDTWLAELRSVNPHFRFATLSTAPVLWHYLGTVQAPGEAAALVGPLDGEMGYFAVEAAVRAKISEHDANPSRVVPCEVVTPATLSDFAARYAKSANGLGVTQYLGGLVEAPDTRDTSDRPATQR